MRLAGSMNRSRARIGCALAAIGLLALAVGCMRGMRHEDLSSAAPGIQGFEEGLTPRRELVFKLGEPAATYEGGKVAVWFLDENQVPRRSNDAGTLFHLVALLDERQVLERITLIRVR